MTMWLVIPVMENETFNYFFSLMIFWGMFLVPLNWCLRIVGRS